MTIKYTGECLTAGFTMRGANTDPNRPPEPPKKDTGPELYRDPKYPTMVQNGLTGGGSSGGGSGNNPTGGSSDTPSARRPFNYERHAEFPWGTPNQYEKSGERTRTMPWGTVYTDHAIDRMQPSGARYSGTGNIEGRSVAPRFVEKTLAYGGISKSNTGRYTYGLGDVEVGASKDQKFVFHVKYTRK